MNRTRNMLREAAQQAASGKTVAVVVLRQDQVPNITKMARDVLGPLIVGETSQGLVVGLGVIRFVSSASAGMTKPTWKQIAGLRIPGHEGPILIDHHVTDSISTPDRIDDYCGCCGRQIGKGDHGRIWCDRCILHIDANPRISSEYRTFESVHGMPCPYQV